MFDTQMYEWYKRHITNETKEYLAQFNLTDEELNEFIEENETLIKETYERNIRYYGSIENFINQVKRFGITDGLSMCLRLLY